MNVINTITKNILPEKIDSLLVNNTSANINIEAFFASLALRCFLKFSMNTQFEYNSKDGVDVEEELCKLVSGGSWAIARMMSLNLPWLSFFPTTRMVVYARKKIFEQCEIAIKKRKAELLAGTAEDIDDCLSAIIRENMSDQEVNDHVTTLVCAGHDTTAYFSAFMVLLLAEHVDVQDKVRAEIIEKVGDKEIITMEDISEFKYLQKVMQETLRLYAVIPFVTREATEEVVVKEANVTIPKGANLMIPFYLLNRDPTIWENPSVFNPDRFDTKVSTGTEFTSAKNGFFPFGYGSRTCIGNTLAQTENGIFIAHLLRRYQFTALPGFKPAIYGGISLTTSNGVHVVVKRL